MELVIPMIVTFITGTTMMILSRRFHEDAHYYFSKRYKLNPPKPEYNFSILGAGHVRYNEKRFNKLSTSKKIIASLSGLGADIFILIIGSIVHYSLAHSKLFLEILIGVYFIWIIHGGRNDIKGVIKLISF